MKETPNDAGGSLSPETGGELLKPDDGGTEVAYEGDVQVGGTIAAIGQRLIDGTAKTMIKKFFDKLASEAAT